MLQKIILTENSNWENNLCLKHLKTVFIGIVYASSLYRTEKCSSSIAGKISSAKIFAQVFSRAFSHAQLVICGLSVFTVKY